MRKHLINLCALAVLTVGGSYLAQAQEPYAPLPDDDGYVPQNCYSGGLLCSNGANCCVKPDGTCMNDCSGATTKG